MVMIVMIFILLCQSECEHNVNGIYWYDVGFTGKTLTQYSFLQTEWLHVFDENVDSSSLWIADDTDMKSGWLFFIDTDNKLIQKMYITDNEVQHTHVVLDIKSIIEYSDNELIGNLAYNADCSAVIIVFTVCSKTGQKGSIIVYDINDQNVTVKIQSVDNKFLECITDVVIDNKCNIYFIDHNIYEYNINTNTYSFIHSHKNDKNEWLSGLQLTNNGLELIVTINNKLMTYWKRFKRDSLTNTFTATSSDILLNKTIGKQEQVIFATNLINYINIFPQNGTGKALTQDFYGNYWIVFSNDIESRIIVLDNKGNMFGLICSNDSIINNIILTEDSNALYITTNHSVIRIPLRPTRKYENIGYWLNPKYIFDPNTLHINAPNWMKSCRESFLKIGSCQVSSFFNSELLSNALSEMLNAKKSRFVGNATVFLQDTNELFSENHPINYQNEYSYVFIDKYELGLDSITVSLYYQHWFVQMISYLFDVKLYWSKAYNRSSYGTVNMNNDFAGLHFDQHPYSSFIMLQAPENGGVFEYFNNIRIYGNDKKTFENIETVQQSYKPNGAPLTNEFKTKYFHKIIPNDNTLYIFQGNVSLHRITKIIGNKYRVAMGYIWSDEPYFKYSKYFIKNIRDKEDDINEDYIHSEL